MARSLRQRSIWPLLAFLVTVIIALWLLLAPTATQSTAEGTRRVSLWQDQGWRAGLSLLIFVVLSAIPLAVNGTSPRRGVAISAAILFVVVTILALPSVGLFFVPAAILLLIAAFRMPGRRGTHPGMR